MGEHFMGFKLPASKEIGDSLDKYCAACDISHK